MLGAESDERAESVVAASNLGEPARRLDSDQNGEREEGAGNRRDPQHRAPTVGTGKRLVDEIGDENADGNRELIRRDEPSTLRGGGEFRRIKRSGDRGDANAEASHEPAEDEDRHVRGEGLYERADDEKSRRGEERALSAKKVGDIAAGERSEHGAQRYPAGDDLECDVTDVERLLDADEGARNDALVVAEKGARQQNDRDDAGGAGEGKVVGNDTRSFAGRSAAGGACCAAPSLSQPCARPPFRHAPYGLAEKTLKEIDRRSNA